MSRKAEDIIEAGKKTRFKKGQSGNPAGRPPGTPNTKTRLERFLQLVQKGKNPVTGKIEEFTVAELMDLQQIARALKGDLFSYREIQDRMEGKPAQKNEISGPGGDPIEGSWIIEIPTVTPEKKSRKK